MELIAPKKFEDNYSLPTLEVLGAMSMTKFRTMKIEGSSGIRSQLYAGDFDGSETVKVESCKEVADHLQMIVKNLRSLPNVVIGDIKVGEMPQWNVFRPAARVENNKIEDFNLKESQSKVDALREGKIITAGEAKHANELLEKADTEWGFLHARKSIRYHILRWTPREILEGAKFVRGNNVVKLEDAVASGGMIKVDAVANIHDRFVEFSVIYNVYVKGKRLTPALPPIVRSLLEDMLYYQRTNPFKAIKRLFSLVKYEKDYASAEKLIPILNGDLGRLYQIIGDLKTLEMLLENRTRPTAQVKQIRMEIDEVRQRLGNIYQLKDLLKEEHTLIGSIITMLKTPIPKLHAKLGAFIDQLQEILTKNTIEQAGGLLKQRTGGKVCQCQGESVCGGVKHATLEGAGKWTDEIDNYINLYKPSISNNQFAALVQLRADAKNELIRLTSLYRWKTSQRNAAKEMLVREFIVQAREIIYPPSAPPAPPSPMRPPVTIQQMMEAEMRAARAARAEAEAARAAAKAAAKAEEEADKKAARKAPPPAMRTIEELKKALQNFMRENTDEQIKKIVDTKGVLQKQIPWSERIYYGGFLNSLKRMTLPVALARTFHKPRAVAFDVSGQNVGHVLVVKFQKDTLYITDPLGADTVYKSLKNLVAEWMRDPDNARNQPIYIKENKEQLQQYGTYTCPHWAKLIIKLDEMGGGESTVTLVNDILGAIKYNPEFKDREYPRDYEDLAMIYGCLRGGGKKPRRVGKKKLTEPE